MVILDKKKCRGCGLCAGVCHQRCITLANGHGRTTARIDHALCSTCSQCIAICPRQAMSWDSVPAVAYEGRRLPSAAQLDELFKQRRTVRRFKEDKVPRALLEEIVGYGVYAPTNNYDLRAIVVDDPATLEMLDGIIMRFVSLLYKLLYRPGIVFHLVKAITPAIDDKARVKMEEGVRIGRAFETLPAALVFVVGDPRIILSEASAQYSLYNMILYAQANGIGSRINGGIPLTLARSRRARQHLGLQRHERILATVELGYPAVRFRNKVEGKRMRVAWHGREVDG